MPKRCGCGETCACVIEPGSGATVDGSGTPDHPYVIGVEGTTTADKLIFDDSATIDFTTTGPGTSTAPMRVSAAAKVALTQLTDVETGAPNTGDVPIWQTDHWEFQPPPAASSGAVSVSNGIGGDGSVATPLKALTSGTWPLPLFTSATVQDSGQRVYIDSTGLLRTRPLVMRGPKPVTDGPDTYPYGVTVMGIGTADAAAWPPASSCLVVTNIREDTPVAAQWCYLNSTTAVKAWLRTGANGSWSPWVQTANDSGWVNITINGGFAAQGTELPQCRLINGIVYLRGGWSSTGITASGTFTIGNIPAGYRPITTCHLSAGCASAASSAFMFCLLNGDVQLRTSATLSSYFMFGGQSWPQYG